MIAPEYFNNHIAVEGEIVVKRVPNDTGSVVVWNSATKKLSIRTHAEIVADLNLATVNTNQLITGIKSFVTSGGNYAPFNNTLQIYADDGSLPSMTYSKGGSHVGQIMFNSDGFYFKNGDNNAFYNVKAGGFEKSNSDNNHVLLGGGDHKAVSDFALSSDLSNVVTTNTAQTVIADKVFKKITTTDWVIPRYLAFPDASGALPNYIGFYMWNSQWQVNWRDASNTYAYPLLDIDGVSKNANFYGNTTAPKFTTPGGNSDQWNEAYNALDNSVTLDTDQGVTGKKIFYNQGQNFSELPLVVWGNNGSKGGIGFVKGGTDSAILNFDTEFHFTSNNNDSYKFINAAGVKVAGSDDNHVILGGGGNKSLDELMTTNTEQDVKGKKRFFTKGNTSFYTDNALMAFSNDGSWPAMTFYRNVDSAGQIIFYGNYFGTMNESGNQFINLKTGGFVKDGSDNNYILLGGGGHIPISNFAGNGFKDYQDNRIIYPDEIATQKLQFGFTGWNNNGDYPYADFLHFGGYQDGSGGNQNLLMLKRNGFGIRQYQAPWQDHNPYAYFVDYWNTENFTQNDVEGWKNLVTSYSKAVRHTGQQTSNLVNYIPTENFTANVGFTPYNYQQKLSSDPNSANTHPDMYQGMMISGNDPINVHNFSLYVDQQSQLFVTGGLYDQFDWKKVWTEQHFSQTDIDGWNNIGNNGVTTNTVQHITNRKFFDTYGSSWGDNSLIVYAINPVNPAMTFYKEGISIGQLGFDGGGFHFVGTDWNGYFPIKTNGFIKNGLDDNSILLAGGGHKSLSDFALSSQFGDFWKKYTIAGYTGINISTPFGFLNGSEAQKAYMGGLLVSNAFQDEGNIPYLGIYSKGNIRTAGLSLSDNGFQNTYYAAGRNRIWSFANSDQYGLSYQQGGFNVGGVDYGEGINFHFGDASKFAVHINALGNVYTKNTGDSSQWNLAYSWGNHKAPNLGHYLGVTGVYTTDINTPIDSYPQGISSNFVDYNAGYGSYGSVLTVKSYVAGGGTLQLYTPYSSQYGGDFIKYRRYNYGTEVWSELRGFWDTGHFTQSNIDSWNNASSQLDNKVSQSGADYYIGWDSSENYLFRDNVLQGYLLHSGNSKPLNNRMDNSMETITASNFNDVIDGNGKIWLGDVYNIPTADTGMQYVYGTIFNLNGKVGHDKTQLIFNGINGNIQYRKSWYNNSAWTPLRTIWDSDNLPNPVNEFQLNNYIPYTGAVQNIDVNNHSISGVNVYSGARFNWYGQTSTPVGKVTTESAFHNLAPDESYGYGISTNISGGLDIMANQDGQPIRFWAGNPNTNPLNVASFHKTGIYFNPAIYVNGYGNSTQWFEAYNKQITNFTKISNAIGDTYKLDRLDGSFIERAYYGIGIVDTRNINNGLDSDGSDIYFPKADNGNLANKMTPIFHADNFDGGNWKSSLIMKGWSGNYKAWRMTGDATVDDIERDFYLSQSKSSDGTWLPYRKIWSDKHFTQANIDSWNNVISNYVTTNTVQDIGSRKQFKGATGNTFSQTTIEVQGNGAAIYPSIGFHQPGNYAGTISMRNSNQFYFRNLDDTDFVYLNSKGYIKSGSDDNHLLLGGGGHKPISDFATNSDLSGYYKINNSSANSDAELIPNGNQIVITANSGSNFDGELSNKTLEGTLANFNGANNSEKRLGFTLFASTSIDQGVYYKTWYGGSTPWRRLIDSVDIQNYATQAQVNSKVNSLENAHAVGFSSGSSTLPPYIYHSSDGYVFLATQNWSNDNLVTLHTDQNNITGKKRFEVGYTNYTMDGLFSSDARPLSIRTPGGNDLLFGYKDYASGQYYPRIGFNNSDPSIAKWSLGALGNVFVLGTDNDDAQTFKFHKSGATSKTQNSTNIFHKVYQGYYDAGGHTGILAIKMPQASPNQAMFSIDINVYGYESQYLGKINVAFYKYVSGTIISNGSKALFDITDNFPTTVARVGIGSDGYVSILLGQPDTFWNGYFSFEVAKVEVKYTNYTLDWSQGWTHALETSISQYGSNLITLPTDVGATRSWVDSNFVTNTALNNFVTTNTPQDINAQKTFRTSLRVVGANVNSNTTKLIIGNEAASNWWALSAGDNNWTEDNLYVGTWDPNTSAWSSKISISNSGVIGTTNNNGTSENWKQAYDHMLPNQNWGSAPGITNRMTIGEMAWKRYGNGHTIFDISSGTTPWNDSKSSVDAEIPWQNSFPTLVGGNGANTYGVRVDSARNADNLGNISAGSYVTQSNLNNQLLGYATLNGVQTFTNTNTFTSSPVIPNGTLGTHAVNKNQIQLNTGTEGENGQQLTISGNNSVNLTNFFVTSRDGSRNPDDIAPNSTPKRVRFDFAYATTAGLGGSGNYAGIMTYSPWDGTSASTGDSSYQLAFANQTGIDGSGIPMLKIRKGINGNWTSLWYKFWTEADFSLTNIQQWNHIAQFGLQLNQTFSATTGYNLMISDDYFGNESGLVDAGSENFVAGRVKEYYKYGSRIKDGLEGINYHLERQTIGIGGEADKNKVSVKGCVKATENFKSKDERADTIFIPDGNVASLKDEIINDESEYAIRLDPHHYEIDPSGYLEVDDRNRLIHVIGEQVKMAVDFKEIYPKQQIVIYNFDQKNYPLAVLIKGKVVYNIEPGLFLRLYVTESLRVIAERSQPCEFVW